MSQWLRFMVMAAALSIGGRLILETGWVNPVVLGFVWIAAFIWLTGLIIGGTADANYLLKVTGGYLAACFGLGIVAALIS